MLLRAEDDLNRYFSISVCGSFQHPFIPHIPTCNGRRTQVSAPISAAARALSFFVRYTQQILDHPDRSLVRSYVRMTGKVNI